jgi:hypothetical protein
MFVRGSVSYDEEEATFIAVAEDGQTAGELFVKYTIIFDENIDAFVIRAAPQPRARERRLQRTVTRSNYHTPLGESFGGANNHRTPSHRRGDEAAQEIAREGRRPYALLIRHQSLTLLDGAPAAEWLTTVRLRWRRAVGQSSQPNRPGWRCTC